MKKLLAGLFALLVFPLIVRAQTADEPSPPPAATAPTTSPAEAPATAPSVPPDVQPLLDQLTQACSSAKTLQLAGTITFSFESADDKTEHSSPFTSVYRSPGLFRHEAPGDLLLISGGVKSKGQSKGYAFVPGRNTYAEFDPAKKPDQLLDELPEPVARALADQDPLLLLALSKDAGKKLVEGASDVKKIDDVKIGAMSYPAIAFTDGSAVSRVAFDPQTHLIRQIQLDLKKKFIERGVDDVKSALLTIDYTKLEAGGSIEDAAFDWTPPKNALAMKLSSGEESFGGGGGGGEAAAALTSKPAPDFTLKSLDGKSVTISKLKGHVVVLDFFATWCGPCVASLPHLDRLHKEKSEKGVMVFAVDQQETADVVQKFWASKNLSLPVLMDSKGDVGKKYKVEGIPQTVVIGKDGLVKKVIIGFGGDDTELRTAIDKALGG